MERSPDLEMGTINQKKPCAYTHTAACSGHRHRESATVDLDPRDASQPHRQQRALVPRKCGLGKVHGVRLLRRRCQADADQVHLPPLELAVGPGEADLHAPRPSGRRRHGQDLHLAEDGHEGLAVARNDAARMAADPLGKAVAHRLRQHGAEAAANRIAADAELAGEALGGAVHGQHVAREHFGQDLIPIGRRRRGAPAAPRAHRRRPHAAAPPAPFPPYATEHRLREHRCGHLGAPRRPWRHAEAAHRRRLLPPRVRVLPEADEVVDAPGDAAVGHVVEHRADDVADGVAEAQAQHARRQRPAIPICSASGDGICEPLVVLGSGEELDERSAP
mmetsp:Transcript_84771/g.237367  ORF Transcript_84771/g.237367 Transcript_84771/m.237367 type:complete len:334 (-) Transcript_84771:995-1996(-)